MSLTDFLLARIAEDEAGQAGGHDYWCSWSQASEPCDCPRKRTMAECEAKRRIVERASLILESRDLVLSAKPKQAAFPDVNRRECSQARANLYDLALPYADHPDYREEWRP